MEMPQECAMLEKNYVTCLHEKSLKDVDVPMKCDVERILWFNIECPTRFQNFLTKEGLSEVYAAFKAGSYE